MLAKNITSHREGCRKVALLIRKEDREGIREKWRIGGDMGLEKSKGRKVTISYNRAKGLDVDKPRNFAKSVTVE